MLNYFRQIFKTRESPKLVMLESVRGNWFYHAGFTKPHPKALCGESQVIPCPFDTLENWGHVSHLNERYCKVCENIMKKIGGIISDRARPSF